MRIIKVTYETVSELGREHSLAWQSSHKGIVSDDFLHSFTPERQTVYFTEEMKDQNKSFHLAYLDDIAIGMISLNISSQGEAEEMGEVISIYLLPDYQRNGYGKQMMDFAVERLKRYQKKSIFLWVMNINQKARMFYEAYGFEYSGVEKILSEEKGITELKYCITIHD